MRKEGVVRIFAQGGMYSCCICNLLHMHAWAQALLAAIWLANRIGIDDQDQRR